MMMAKRVLVADDDPAMVELLREFLLAKGYEVITAGDGAEALQKVKEERPHLILLDIQMPKMDGLEVLRQLRQIDPTVSVIMITGVNEEAIGRQAMALGAFDYIVKPLDLPYLERSLWYKLTTDWFYRVTGYCRGRSDGKLMIPNIAEYRQLCTTEDFQSCENYQTKQRLLHGPIT
jgi:CheY-like chemotaxis protein